MLLKWTWLTSFHYAWCQLQYQSLCGVNETSQEEIIIPPLSHQQFLISSLSASQSIIWGSRQPGITSASTLRTPSLTDHLQPHTRILLPLIWLCKMRSTRLSKISSTKYPISTFVFILTLFNNNKNSLWEAEIGGPQIWAQPQFSETLFQNLKKNFFLKIWPQGLGI